MKLLKDKKGSAFVFVVITMLVLVALGAMVYFIAISNYSMKVIDKKSKDNFYSAEEVLDDICVGLEDMMSDAYVKAYTLVMGQYNTYDEDDEDVAYEDFKQEFVLSLIEELRDVTNENLYNLNILIGFLKTYDANAVVTVSNSGSPRIDTLEDGLILRNITVEYKDEKGFYDKITTDIKLGVPKIEFVIVDSIPDIVDYAIIADSGIEVSDNCAVEIKGKVYANRIDINNNGYLSVPSPESNNDPYCKLLILQNNLNLMGNGTAFISEKTKFWARNVDLFNKNNNIVLNGRTYILDDLTVSGDNNSVSLAGQYYGYSYSVDAMSPEKNSAIVINGSNTSLDVSSLETLVVAGTACVATKNMASANGITENNIALGESVAIKGCQLAYLVPTECAGIISNPMTYEQYASLISNNKWIETALNTTIQSLKRSINSYGSVTITPVFHASANGESSVYLYLNFAKTENASAYFMDICKTSQGKIQEYLSTYLKAITTDVNATRVITKGNYLTAVGEATETGWDFAESSALITNSLTELGSYADVYDAMCANLSTYKTSLTTEELSKTVYENMVNEAMLVEFLQKYYEENPGAPYYSGSRYLSMQRTGENNEKVYAVVVDNKGRDAFAVNTDGSGIILATGDVIINGAANWDGIVICGGKVKIVSGSKTNPSSFTENTVKTRASMELTQTVGGVVYSIKNFFKGNENISLSTDNTMMNMADVRNCINFVNYTSE